MQPLVPTADCPGHDRDPGHVLEIQRGAARLGSRLVEEAEMWRLLQARRWDQLGAETGELQNVGQPPWTGLSRLDPGACVLGEDPQD